MPENCASVGALGAAAVDRIFAEGADIIKAHAGLTREDYFAIVKAAHAHKMKVHAHVYDETAVRNAFDAGVDVLQHVGSAGNPTFSAQLVKDIASAGRPVVLTAAELLTNAAEHGGPVEFARIATLRALNRGVERTFDPERKTRAGVGAS